MISQKKAIIVGASSGIGREVAQLLIDRGWRVGIAARREAKLLELQNQHPQQVVVQTIDVNADDASQRLLQLIDRLGGMSLYFHASGIGKQNRPLEPAIELNTVQTNALGFTDSSTPPSTILQNMAEATLPPSPASPAPKD